MEKTIAKLKSLKSEMSNANNGGLITGIYWRLESLIDKEFGAQSTYSKLLKRVDTSDTKLSLYLPDVKGKLKGVIDYILDDIEEPAEKNTIPTLTVPTLSSKASSIGKLTDTKLQLNNKIFVVHGHNEVMKQSVARIIERLGLEPIILHEQPNQGLTVIEKFLSHSNVGFAVVLLSSDDVGYSKTSNPSIQKTRARQNVIFELGFFIAKLGRKSVIALVEETHDFELPSDYYGILYVPFDGSNGKWKFEFAKELLDNGYLIDINKIM